MAHIKHTCTFRYEGNIYEKVGVGSYRLLSPCLENYTEVKDKSLIAALDKHTENWKKSKAESILIDG